MSDRKDSTPPHPRRRAVVPPFLPPRSTGGDQRARPQPARPRFGVPPFTPPHARRAIVAEPYSPLLTPEPMPTVPALEDLTAFDLAREEAAAQAEGFAVPASPTDSATVTDWLEEEVVEAVSSPTDAAEVEDRLELVESVDDAHQADAKTEWPAEAWEGLPWTESAVSTGAGEQVGVVDSAAPVTPFEFAAEFPAAAAFTAALPSAGQELPPENWPQEPPSARGAPWVPPTVQPIEMAPNTLAAPLAGAAAQQSALDTEREALERLKATEPWAIAGAAAAQSAPVSATPPGDVIAAALERIARRIRVGEVVLPEEGATTTDEAALALTLAALLRSPPSRG